MSHDCELPWIWIIVILLLCLGNWTQHHQLRDVQRRIAVLEQTK